MKLKLVATALTVVLATCGSVRPERIHPKRMRVIDGVWRGQTGDLPFITLVITDEPGSWPEQFSFTF